MLQLKPCPFCGGRAVFSRIPGHGFSILCKDCGALAVLTNSSQRELLGAGWNRRTQRPNFSVQSKVEACPFCASRMDLGMVDKQGSILQCGKCGMMVSFVQSESLPDTVQRWNRRAK